MKKQGGPNGAKGSELSVDAAVELALKELKARSKKATRDGMARYAIPADNALGVAVADIRAIAKQFGRRHDLARGLWATGVYEARMLAAYVGEPERLTAREMDRWCKDFDSWAICDTVCFHLFDRSPHAWGRVSAWATRRAEFEKRAGFALLWGLAVHDREAGDAKFAEALVLVEREAHDDRNFVKKAASMAMRAVGKRNKGLRTEAVAAARRLAAAEHPGARWVGKDVLRELGRG